MGRMIGTNGLLGIIVLAMIFTTASCAAPATSVTGDVAPELMNIRDVIKECIVEPVFEASACIYQANRTAEQTIVLVHGVNGRALGDWKNQIPLLAKKYHVLTFDLPGFGDSSKDVAYYSPTKYAKFIDYVVKRYAHGNIILVGHSMGGAISLRYLANYPDTVERLVLVDVAGVLHRVAYVRQLANGWVKSSAGDNSGLISFADKMTNRLLSKMEPLAGPFTNMMAEQFLKRELLNVDASAVSMLTLSNEDLSDALLKVDPPTMIVWGEHDLVAPMRTAQLLREHIPDARFEVIAGAAHVPMIDAPDQFNRVLMDYLDDIDSNTEEDTLPVDDDIDGAARVEVCRKKTGQVYQGHYESLTLISCKGVIIKNATIGELVIRSSTATIENSTITSDKTALNIDRSEILITATQLSGDVAIYTSGSRLDLAAVTLVGKSASVQGGRSSSLVFSVSKISSPLATRTIHEFLKINRKKSL